MSFKTVPSLEKIYFTPSFYAGKEVGEQGRNRIDS